MAEHICPVWVGYLLASPLRKLWQSPHKIVAPYIEKGDVVLDIGCAMGFFSIPMAEMVGERGKVICVDVQNEMLGKLKRRAEKTAVFDRIVLRQCEFSNLHLDDHKDQIAFALAFSVAHEVPDQGELFSQVYAVLKPGGNILLSEPKGHVSFDAFAQTVLRAKNAGLKVQSDLRIPKSRSVLLQK